MENHSLPVEPRRRLLLGAVLATGAALAPGFGAWAQAAYPGRPVRVIMPFAAGGITDLVGRLFSDWLQGQLGQPFVFENRAGAGTRLGTELVMRAPRDGHTLYFTNASYASLPLTDPTAKYDPEKDLDPVAPLATYGLAIVVKNSLPVKTLAEFID